MKHGLETVLFSVGIIGFLIGGSGLDGPTFASSAILTAASFMIATVGYKMREKSEYGISLAESKSTRKERNIETAKEVVKRTKEATFRMWVESCRMDESV